MEVPTKVSLGFRTQRGLCLVQSRMYLDLQHDGQSEDSPATTIQIRLVASVWPIRMSSLVRLTFIPAMTQVMPRQQHRVL